MPDLAALGALIGDRVRADVLLRLIDGEAASASDLAAAAGVSPSLASAHLRRLLDGGLVTVEPRGRRRLYRLASGEVAEALEALQVLATPDAVTSLRGASNKRWLRRARLCYDHLAGLVGVSVTDGLVARGALSLESGSLRLGPDAAAVLAEIDVDLVPVLAAPRPALRDCLDWTERRPHAAGGLGAAVAARLLEQSWVVRRPLSRGLDVTVDGADGLQGWLGLDVRSLDEWSRSA